MTKEDTAKKILNEVSEIEDPEPKLKRTYCRRNLQGTVYNEDGPIHPDWKQDARYLMRPEQAAQIALVC